MLAHTVWQTSLRSIEQRYSYRVVSGRNEPEPATNDVCLPAAGTNARPFGMGIFLPGDARSERYFAFVASRRVMH